MQHNDGTNNLKGIEGNNGGRALQTTVNDVSLITAVIIVVGAERSGSEECFNAIVYTPTTPKTISNLACHRRYLEEELESEFETALPVLVQLIVREVRVTR